MRHVLPKSTGNAHRKSHPPDDTAGLTSREAWHPEKHNGHVSYWNAEPLRDVSQLVHDVFWPEIKELRQLQRRCDDLIAVAFKERREFRDVRVERAHLLRHQGRASLNHLDDGYP